MTDEQVSPLRGSVQYEYKVDRGNYTNEVARVFLPIDFEPGLSGTDIAEQLVEAFNVAKAAVADTLGLDVEMTDAQVLVVKSKPVVTTETVVRGNGNRSNGGGAPAPAADPGDFRVEVNGTQHGDLPDWIHAAAHAAGVKKVWDNRDQLAENAKRPWFKEFCQAGKGKNNGQPLGFWPPKER